MLKRVEFEKREEEMLAPYAAKSARSLGRKFDEPEHPYRTRFQRDRDRIIYSSAFRRLKYKTQVYVEHEGDYFRTRLTHTMEACQIARTIARALNLNEDLTEALALSHDLGHPPFGHAGEEVLRDCMRENGGFEHNIQGLRIVEILENRYPDFPGLNLTWEVRESMRKHGLRHGTAVEQEYKPERSSLLECQLVDKADLIAYCAHDLDDALKAGLLTLEQVSGTRLLNDVVKEVLQRHSSLKGELLVRQVVKQVIEILVSGLIASTEKQIKKLSINSLEDVRGAQEDVVIFSEQIQGSIEELYSFLLANVYKHYRVVRMAEKAKKFVRDLFTCYVNKPAQLPPQFHELAKKFTIERVVCDYIAGMTDRYAQEEVKRLFYPFEPLL